MRGVVEGYLSLVPFWLLLCVVLGALVWGACRLSGRGRVRSPHAEEEHTAPAQGRWLTGWLLVCWLAGVVLVTIVSSLGMSPPPPDALGGASRVDLVPLRSLVTEGVGLGGIAVVERLANIAMFAVGGLLTALTFRWPTGRTALAFLALGVVIEAAQFLLPGHRAVTADDVLWAALGGLLGGLVARRLRAGPRTGR